MPLPWALGLKTVTLPTSQRPWGSWIFCALPKKVLRFPIQDTCCKTQWSKLCWASFAFCSLWGRSHPTHRVDQTGSLSIMDGSRAAWGLNQHLEGFWEEVGLQGARMMNDEAKPVMSSLFWGCHTAAVGDTAEPGWSSHSAEWCPTCIYIFHARILTGHE